MSQPTEKLQKILADSGLGSRREMEKWIAAGRVTIDDRLATLGDRSTREAKIRVDGRLINPQATEQHQYLIYNKPEGEMCTRTDPEGRATVFDRLPKLHKQRWIMVGRLDLNTSGLLLFTTDGELANRLMHPSSEIEREYAVRVLGKVTVQQLQNLLDGVQLEDGPAKFSHIEAIDPKESANQWFRVVLKEGRNREVRRLWETQGLTVSRLVRIRFGDIQLPNYLKRGEYKYLTIQAITKLSSI